MVSVQDRRRACLRKRARGGLQLTVHAVKTEDVEQVSGAALDGVVEEAIRAELGTSLAVGGGHATAGAEGDENS